MIPTQKQLNNFNFIRQNKDFIEWHNISYSLKFSEDFIREFQDKVNWNYISYSQKLSESFIREFQNKVNWINISIYQKLSEDFIREFKDKLYWFFISQNQTLSESFIREFQDKVNWINISKYQKLSEDLIREFKDKVNWDYISDYQKLSPEFVKEFNLTIYENNWLYKTKEFKLNYIKENTKYKVIDNNYIIAYKSTKKDGYSVCKPNFYQYQVGQTYISNCDCNSNIENSFGLSAWTKEEALKYHSDGDLYLIKINIDDIGCITNTENKIRVFKIEILEKVN